MGALGSTIDRRAGDVLRRARTVAVKLLHGRDGLADDWSCTSPVVGDLIGSVVYPAAPAKVVRARDPNSSCARHAVLDSLVFRD